MKRTHVPFALLIAAALMQSCAQKEQTDQQVSDSTKTVYSTEGKSIRVVVTDSIHQYRLAVTDTTSFEPFGQPLESQACIFVDPDKTFQTVLGIGGAITDASAETFYKLSKEKQHEIIDAYYNAEKGIGYSLLRTNIQSCDFSSGTYAYVSENDSTLKSFSIEHDKQYRIPMIKEAIKTAGGKLTTYASPWSPPAWMKDTKNALKGGKLLPQYHQAWATMYTLFIKAYEKEGIPIWGLTVQNEPMAVQTWESCVYTAEEERDFVKNFLGPTLHKEGFADKNLVIWDHNRDLLYQRASTVLNDPEAAKYVWGTGFHWYVHDAYENVKRVQEAFPDKHLLFTEGCSELYNRSRIGEWRWGEKYGKAIITDFNNGVVGWTDWNILLDETGGPNHVGNMCYAPLHADTKTGELTYMNSFYYLGHFSKYVKPGAKRIISSSNRDAILTTAFLNTDGSVAVVVMNSGKEDIPYKLWIKGQAAEAMSYAHSMTTLVF